MGGIIITMPITSYKEYEAHNKKINIMSALNSELNTFSYLVNNISEYSFDEPELYASSVVDLAREMALRLEKRISEFSSNETVYEAGIMKSFGKMWAGIPSNNFLDKEYQIVESSAHEEYVAAIQKGDALLPELWYNHIPFAWGYTKGVFFDKGTGMLIAYGEWRTDDPVVEKGWNVLIKDNNLGMSHAGPALISPSGTVKKYRPHELTFLPVGRAANSLTSFRGGIK